MDNLNKVSKYFWITIVSIYTLIFSYIMFHYSVFSGIIALMPFITIIVSQYFEKRFKKNVIYYIRNIPEYIYVNFISFLIFITALKFLNANFFLIKVLLFCLMTIVGIFTTYSLLKVTKNQLN